MLRLLCERFGWDTGALWLPDRGTGGLRRLASLWLQPPASSELDRISSYATAMPGVGIVGRVFTTGEVEWLADLEDNAAFVRGAAAPTDGLRSMLAVPVTREGRTVGVVELFSKQKRAKDEATAAALCELAQRLFTAGGSALTRVTGGSLRHLVEEIPDIAAVLDLQGVILYESRAVTEVLGYTLDERIGHNVFEFIHKEDTPRTVETIQAAFREPGSVHKIEVRARHKDGSWRWLQTVGRVESDEASGYVIVATSRDITEAKSAQEALLQRDARLEMITAIAKELIAGKSTIEIISRAIFHLSRHHPDLRVTYWTIAENDMMTVTHSAQPPEMRDITGLTVDLSRVPGYVEALRSSPAVAVGDVFADTRLAPLANAFRSAGSAAIATACVRQSRGLLGQVGFGSLSVRRWSDHEISTLEEVAAMISIALREAQHVELRRVAERNLRRAAKDLNEIFEAFPELGVGVNGGAASTGKRRPRIAAASAANEPAQPRLSGQDLRVLRQVAEGLTNSEIAERLHLSAYTVKDHLKAVMKKLHAKNRAEAVVIAAKRGLV